MYLFLEKEIIDLTLVPKRHRQKYEASKAIFAKNNKLMKINRQKLIKVGVS